MNLIEALKETGIVRRKSWLNSKYRVYPDHERRCFKAVDSDGIPYFIDMSFENIIAEDWEPYKNPCKHEPEIVGVIKFSFSFGESLLVSDSEAKCKNCGAKIKATGWELA